MNNSELAENAEIKAGQHIEIRIGRNTVKVEVVAVDGILLNVRNPKTGKTFAITRNRVARIPDETEATEPRTPETPEQTVPASYAMVDAAIANAQQYADRLAAIMPPNNDSDDANDCDATACDGNEANGHETQCDDCATGCGGTPCDENTKPKASAEEPEQRKEEPPRRKHSLLDAAYCVLAESKTPLNTKELVRLAVERGFWIPTACATPEQSLYGAIFREIKEKEHPRFRRSEKRKGSFEADA